jgi:hypothetical protein
VGRAPSLTDDLLDGMLFWIHHYSNPEQYLYQSKIPNQLLRISK